MSKEKRMTYNRSMIARVTLPHNVGFLGKEHNVMVVHMHNELANNVHGQQKLEHVWDWLSEKIRIYEVQVLMGDFNMSLFRVIPELRSRGAVIDLGAWYPWKSLRGEPMSDSCGIFFVYLPGVYTLNKNLGDIHEKNPTGVLMWADTWEGVIEDADDEDVVDPAHGAVSVTSDESDEGEDQTRKQNGGFDRIDDNAGPGQSLTTYLPKGAQLFAKMSPSLTPSEGSAAVADSRGRSCGPSLTPPDRDKGGIKLKEKRLDARLWRYNGGPSER